VEPGPEHEHGDVEEPEQRQGAGNGDGSVVEWRGDEEIEQDVGIAHDFQHQRGMLMGDHAGHVQEEKPLSQGMDGNAHQCPWPAGIVRTVERLFQEEVAEEVFSPIEADGLAVRQGSTGVQPRGDEHQRPREEHTDQDSPLPASLANR